MLNTVNFILFIFLFELDGMISLLAEFIFTHEWSTLTDEKKETRMQLTKEKTEQLFFDSSSSDSSVSVVEQTPSPLRRTNRENAGKRNHQLPPTCSNSKI